MKQLIFLPLAVVLALSACEAKYAVKPGVPTANLYLQDGHNFQSHAFVSRDAKNCAKPEKFNQSFKIRPPDSIRGPFQIEANAPLAVMLHGFYFALGTSLVYECNVIFSSTFKNDQNYLIRLDDRDDRCGVLVYQSDSSDVPTMHMGQPVAIESRRHTSTMFSNSPISAE